MIVEARTDAIVKARSVTSAWISFWPGGEVLVSREPQEHHAHEDVYVAIHDAFNAAARHRGSRSAPVASVA